MGFLREMFGSGLGQGDPRALFVEAMVAAIDADGEVTEAELDRLHTLLDRHDVFAALTHDARTKLVDEAAEAIETAGGWRPRVAAIADGLGSHDDRLTAYCLASEVCVTDGTLPQGEIAYLEALQAALGLPNEVARELFESVRRGSSVLTIEERTTRMKELVPRFLDAMVLMARADGHVDKVEHNVIADLVPRLVSRRVFHDGEARAAVDAAFSRVGERDTETVIAELGAALTTSLDRFWTMTSLMVVALADDERDWQELGLAARFQTALHLDSRQMNQALQVAERIVKNAALA
jgi:uncharacterized membrane protein YebE (DUF533 family)